MTMQEAINAVHEISSSTPHNGYMRSSDTIELVYRVLRDHEEQLKAKDEEIAKYQMAIDKQSKRAEALKQLSLDKDNEIATAKMRHKLEHDRYLITEAIIKEKDEEIERLECRAYHAEGYINDLHNNPKDKKFYDKKARSIVAMLFWEWKKSQRWAGKNHFASKGNEDAFKKAYKILKDNK